MSDLRFLYNDGELFAIYKAPGLHSVRLPKGGGHSLADALLAHSPHLKDVSKNPGDAGLINRLDEDTSGILLGAWSRPVWEQLFVQLLSGSVIKKYKALVEGHLSTPQSIKTFIGTPHRGARKMKVYEQEPPAWARALEGTTVFLDSRFLETLKATLVTVSASPARRHQIRLHSSHIGRPLVGDVLYGSTRELPSPIPHNRSFLLHAEEVSFSHPSTGQEILITCPIEDELALPQ